MVKNSIKVLAVALLFLSTNIMSQAAVSRTVVPDITNPAVVEAFVDGVVMPQMKKNHSPSGVVTLMKDGEIIFAKGYGYQDVEKSIPVNPATTLFRPGSISKLFTWISVMQQVERENLDLDTDVNEYLKTFQIEDTWPGQPVTLRDIMSHTAGFEDGGIGYLIIDDVSRIEPLAIFLANHIPVRVNPPGEHTAYSNWATAVAGLIVSNVSGVEFNDYVQQNIFDVLGMKQASFVEPLPPELDSHMAKAYGWKQGKYFEKNYEIIANFGPAGSLAATSYDMALFARAILGGGELLDSSGKSGRILKTKTMEQMLTTLYSHDTRTRGLAYGFLEYPYNGIEIIGHDGGTTIFLSHFGLSLENNLMLFFSFSGPGNVDIYRVFASSFYDYFYPPKQQTNSYSGDFTERADSFAGTYKPWRANFTKIEALLGALSAVTVTPMDDNSLLVDDTRFVEEQKNLFRQVDGERRIVFQENDAGEITGYINDGAAVNQMYKASFYGTLPFTLFFLILSVVVFIAVLLRRSYQGAIYKALPSTEKNAFRASLLLSASNLLFLIVAAIALVTARDLMYELPWLFKFSLVFPIIAFLATIYHVYQSVLKWRSGEGSVWSRLRFSIVSFCGVMMIWIYNYWNFLGFNYFT